MRIKICVVTLLVTSAWLTACANVPAATIAPPQIAATPTEATSVLTLAAAATAPATALTEPVATAVSIVTTAATRAPATATTPATAISLPTVMTVLTPTTAGSATAMPGTAAVTGTAVVTATASGRSRRATPGAVTTPVSSTTSDLCGNDYYPVNTKGKWTYTTNSGGQVSEYTTTYVGLNPTGFTERRLFEDSTTEIEWRCTGQGFVSVEYGPFLVENSPFNLRLGGGITGVTLAPGNQLAVDAAWKQLTYVRGTTTIQNGVAMTGTGAIEASYRVTGSEKVQVPAGVYDTWKVESSNAIKLSPDAGNPGAVLDLTLPVTTYLARGIGMVKQVVGAGPGSAGTIITTELKSYRED